MLAINNRLNRKQVKKLAKNEHFFVNKYLLVKYESNLGARLSVAVARKVKACNADKLKLRRQIKAIFIENKPNNLDLYIIVLRKPSSNSFEKLKEAYLDFIKKEN